MKQKGSIVLGVAVMLMVGSFANAQSSSCTPTDEAAIRQLVKEFAATWTTHSPSKYAAPFAEDADWENAFGDHTRGRAEIEKAMATVMQTFSTADETITDVRVLCIRPDVAVVDIYETIAGQKTPRGTPIPTRHVRLSQIHEKREGKWFIRVHRTADLRGFNKQSAPDENKQSSATPLVPSKSELSQKRDEYLVGERLSK